MGVIKKVDEPTELVGSMVVVEKKSGKLRACLGLHDLNKAILRSYYPIQTIDVCVCVCVCIPILVTTFSE